MRLIYRSHLHDFSLLLAVVSAGSATSLSLCVGAAVWAVGVALHIWSKAALRRNDVLSTTGPYALCRHPFYLGNAIFDLGICVMSGNPWLAVLYPFAFWAGYLPTMRREEAELSRLHPAAYAEFRRVTPRVVPTFRRALRNWRAPLSWQNLRAEQQFSRTLRYASFPLLVWLAARLWDAPTDPLNSWNLAILGAAASFGMVALVVYGSYELRTSRASTLALRVAPHAGFAAVVVLLAAVALQEAEMGGLAIAAIFTLLMVGWTLAIQSWGALSNPSARTLGLCVTVGLVGLVGLAASELDMLWALPALIGIALLGLFAPVSRPCAPRLCLATAAALLLIGTVSVGAFHRKWDALRTLNPILAAVQEETREDDMVVILKDHELHALADAPGIDDEVTGKQLGHLARVRPQRGRFFVIAEDNDMHQIPHRLRAQMLMRRKFHVWTDTFYLLEVPAPTTPLNVTRVHAFAPLQRASCVCRA